MSSSSVWVENGSSKITLIANKAGTTEIIVEAENVGASDGSEKEITGSKPIAIKVTDSSSSSNGNLNSSSSSSTNNPSRNTSNSTSNAGTTNKSSDATLRNLGITPKAYDFSGFSKLKTNYSVKVDNDVTRISIYAYATDSKATVTGIGTKSLKKGSNTFPIKVTAEDGKTTKTYSLTINRTNEDDAENNTTENNTTNNTTENNTVNEENSNTESTDSGLTNLEVEGYTISPAFSGDIYIYSVDLPDGTKSININTEKINDELKVEIIGNDNLETGTNYITILVYNGDETTTYQVVANVGTTSEESIATANTNTQNAKSKIKSSWGKIIIAIIVLIFIIYLIIRHKRKNYFDDEDEDYYDTDEENNDPYRMNIDSYNPYNENLSPEKESDYSEDIEDVKKTKRHKRAKGRRYK